MRFFSPEPIIGFSTGAVAKGDWRSGLRSVRDAKLPAVELSALRLEEVPSLVSGLDKADYTGLKYISVHLPSKYAAADEKIVLELAERVAGNRWPLILHPDTIYDWTAWRRFGPLVCIENMDKRKAVGRTVGELRHAFDRLPEATFCFDFGHARQVDPTMSQGADILQTFADRLKQIHFSDVDTSNHHQRLNRPALEAFSRLQGIDIPGVPVILETPVFYGGLENQVELARDFFAVLPNVVYA